MTKYFLSFALLFCMVVVNAQTTQMVKDINIIDGGEVGRQLYNVNGTLFFIKKAGANKFHELWKSDGTSAGTVLVKNNLIIDVSSTSPVIIGGTFFFVASDTTSTTSVNTYGDVELWKSDGTTAGTVRVKDINSGLATSLPRDLINVNGILYFTATAFDKRGIWKSDGTEAGTVLITNFVNSIYSNSDPTKLTAVNGTIFFSASDGVSGRELWKSDGTAAGTVMVKDIYPGGPYYYLNNGLDNLTLMLNVNGTLYFTATDGTHGKELWKSDGTAAGTVLVKDLNLGSGDGIGGNLINFNGTLLFNGFGGYYTTDGTDAGTVKNLAINTLASQLTVLNGYLYYTIFLGSTGDELWKSDGTVGGTNKLITILRTGIISDPILTSMNNNLYFVNYTPVAGQELWKTDGTVAGTVMVKDIIPGSEFSYPTSLTAVNNTLYFASFAGSDYQALWKTDGTAAGTVKLKEAVFNDTNFGSGAESPEIEHLTNVNGTAFFVATDSFHGNELWKSDGTKAGTVLVKDINPIGASYPRRFCEVNGILYFAANNGTNGEELWKSDGTEAGTVMVKDIFAGSSNSSPNFITNVNGTIFFIATNSANGRELWKSDGTAAGTVLVKDIFPLNTYNDSSIPRNLVNFNGTLYFSANDNVHGRELWKSDGTLAGTVMAVDIRPGEYGGIYPAYCESFCFNYETNLVVSNNLMFFQTLTDNGLGVELWKSDGTPAGTSMVKDIRIGSGSGLGFGDELLNVNGIVYFNAVDDVYGGELWKSDGTEIGTVMVKDIYTGVNQYGTPNSGTPRYITNVNGTLYFNAVDDYQNYELWKSDGTAAGTAKVKETDGASGPNFLTKVSNLLYFGLSKSGDGRSYQLWKSDGTEAGTTLVKDIKMYEPFTATGPYRNMLEASGKLFFYAEDNLHGSELWAVIPSTCSSSLTLVSPTDDISGGTVIKQASAANGSISATNKVTGNGTKATYQAKNILLSAGFKADNGTVFKAEIGGCSN